MHQKNIAKLISVKRIQMATWNWFTEIQLGRLLARILKVHGRRISGTVMPFILGRDVHATWGGGDVSWPSINTYILSKRTIFLNNFICHMCER